MTKTLTKTATVVSSLTRDYDPDKGGVSFLPVTLDNGDDHRIYEGDKVLFSGHKTEVTFINSDSVDVSFYQEGSPISGSLEWVPAEGLVVEVQPPPLEVGIDLLKSEQEPPVGSIVLVTERDGNVSAWQHTSASEHGSWTPIRKANPDCWAPDNWEFVSGTGRFAAPLAVVLIHLPENA